MRKVQLVCLNFQKRKDKVPATRGLQTYPTQHRTHDKLQRVVRGEEGDGEYVREIRWSNVLAIAR